MNITSLQTLITIVETGSLVRASEKLNVTQSTVTARLKTLELELGQVLLVRQKSGVSLTPSGTKMLRYARVMTGLWRQAQREAGLPSGLKSVCTLGCQHELWQGLGKELFYTIDEEHPEMALTLHQGNDVELEEWLAEGMVDIVLTLAPISKRNQTIYILPEEEIALYSDRAETPIKEDPSYIYVDYGEDYRRFHAEAYFDAGVGRVNFASATCALEYLIERGGSAYLPRHITKPYVSSGCLHKLADAPEFLRSRYLVGNDLVTENWPWFQSLIANLQQKGHPQ
jgi:DNA-binding transcriptional LysR family regulator